MPESFKTPSNRETGMPTGASVPKAGIGKKIEHGRPGVQHHRSRFREAMGCVRHRLSAGPTDPRSILA
jgi:hypothetical protein